MVKKEGAVCSGSSGGWPWHSDRRYRKRGNKDEKTGLHPAGAAAGAGGGLLCRGGGRLCRAGGEDGHPGSGRPENHAER